MWNERASENEEKLALESGMLDLLQKPAAFNDLKTKIFFNLNKLQENWKLLMHTLK